MKPPPRKDLLAILSVAVVLAGLIYLAQFAVVRVYDQLHQEPFAPIRLERFVVQDAQVSQGSRLMVLNGVCNDSKTSQIVSVYIGAQSVVDDPVLQGKTVDVTGTASAGQKIVIDPGCIYEQAIPIQLPSAVGPGKWRLFVQLITQNARDKRQIVNMTSGQFDVIGQGQ